ncbi:MULTISPECIES: hypothetical protein [Shewanella]|uniref:Uncharacterized protein n=2 Tax=Shewanella TaxID=22 RepID=A0A9X1ZAU4_9GAMM|nr:MULTISPECIES: hypothetical protein [Shewanella]MCL1103416.1 hypothetical protein [Shewanella saliphila]MCL1107339.1 hypothetical protein [Shewanella algicola]GGP69531.1 hypothetical protein GCM10009409_37910 [Shewanella saliphila]GGP69974.1 hypothetical protein GCM10009347_38960 [Shewanella algicola]
MIINLIEKIKFNRKYGKSPNYDELFINEWLKEPEAYFFGYYGAKLEWTTGYGIAPLEGLPDTHGYSSFPDIRCQYKEYKYSLKIGNVEGISMHSGGTVRIRHFALNADLTKNKLGEKFLNSIIEFFKSKNAVIIEFHESHSSKIAHYRKFFKRLGIPEVKGRIWQVELYSGNNIPKNVLSFHEKLKIK